jgi:oxalate decarboxylase
MTDLAFLIAAILFIIIDNLYIGLFRGYFKKQTHNSSFEINFWGKIILYFAVIFGITYIFIHTFKKTTNSPNYDKYKLDLSKQPMMSPRGITGALRLGGAVPVDQSNFPVLTTFTTYYVEIFDESMRAIHVHDSDELGYVFEGAIEVFLWLDDKTYTKSLCTAGNCYFIPRGSLHSLNNVGEQLAKIYIGFNTANPSNIDIGVVLNGLPVYLKQAYSGSPHSLLKDYVGSNSNIFFTNYPKNELDIKVLDSSKYVFNMNDAEADFFDEQLGLIKYTNKYNWEILTGMKFSFSKMVLAPNVSTDCFWYSNVDANYCIVSGEGDIFMMMPGYNNYNENNKVPVKTFQEFFVPRATPHVIRNKSKNQVLHIGVFFSDDNANYVPLGASMLFFTNKMIQEQIVSPNKVSPSLKNEKAMRNINRLIKISQ